MELSSLLFSCFIFELTFFKSFFKHSEQNKYYSKSFKGSLKG